MKVTKDSFVWLTLNSDKAVEIWEKEAFELYILHDDESETLIKSKVQLANAIVCGFQFGIEVGKLTDFIPVAKAVEAHKNVCPMTNCVNCLFGYCDSKCQYQEDFKKELNDLSDEKV